MSKLADLLKKPAVSPVPAAGGGNQIGKRLAIPKQIEQPVVAPASGSTSPFAGLGKPAVSADASEDVAPIARDAPRDDTITNPTVLIAPVASLGIAATAEFPANAIQTVNPVDSPLQALANVDIQLTTDVSQWPKDELSSADESEAAQGMRMLLEELASVLVTDDVSLAMQRVMVFMHENPALVDQLLPADIQLCVKALQSSHGVVIAKKTAGRAKVAGKKEKIDNLAGDLADLGFGS